MAIELITGLPGNGKTLYTIGMLKARAEREGRAVYYHGIPELTLPWIHLEDPTQWHKCPPNSLVVIDEAQKVFRNRSISASPPEHVTALETHRHLGIDLILITQHPRLIDPAVKSLTQTHRHLVRLFGRESSTVHTWNGCKDNCDKQRKDSEKTKYIFDKSIYSLYKSAEVHTVTKSFPFIYKFLIGASVAVIVLVAVALKSMNIGGGAPSLSGSSGSAKSSSMFGGSSDQQSSGGASSSGPVFDPLLDARKFVHSNTPRVQGVAHTAPKYDELSKPTSVPVPAMCIRRGDRCQCYTQQATKLQVPPNVCLDIAHNGYFQDFNPNGREDRFRDGARESTQSVQVAAAPTNAQGVYIPFIPDPKPYWAK